MFRSISNRCVTALLVVMALGEAGSGQPPPEGAAQPRHDVPLELPARPLDQAQTPPPAPTRTGESATSQPAAAEGAPAPLPGPKYFRLRYDDDFSYLDGPEGSYRKDCFDPIKWIHLSDDLTLSVGGELRFRMEAETNKSFDEDPRSQDTFTLYRSLMHFDFKYRDWLRLFVEGSTAWEEDRDLEARNSDENEFEIEQLFVDLKTPGGKLPLTLRVGSQHLHYGIGRFVNAPVWANVRRRFSAVKLFWKDPDWQFDVWYAKPITIKNNQLDDWDEQFDFYGAWFTYKGILRHAVDVFFLAIDNTNRRTNPNGNAGNESRYTFGGRFSGKTEGWDYDAYLAGQWGHWADDTIQGWHWGVDGGYTLVKLPWTPRIGTRFDWASGDEDPEDAKVGTYNPLFPRNHNFFGFLDLISRQNITAVSANLSAWPIPEQVEVGMQYHTFWLNAAEDSLYNTNGGTVRRDRTGRAGTEVGHEIDLTLTWTLDVHSSLLIGYSHFFDSDVIINTGKSEDPDLFYVQYRFQF